MFIHRIAAGVLLCLSAVHADAASFCVADANTFQIALNAALASPEADEIRLVSVEFELPSQGIDYTSPSDAPKDVNVVGGFDAGCISRSKGSKTLLDASAVMAHYALNFNVLNSKLSLSNLIIFGKPDSGDPLYNSALRIRSTGNVAVESNLFFSNHGSRGAALLVRTVDNEIRVVDNLFVQNQSSHSVVSVGSTASHCLVLNNTVTDNQLSGTGAAVEIGDCQAADVLNNVFWGHGFDLNLYANSFPGSPYRLSHNDIGLAFVDSSVTLAETGRISEDPDFASGVVNYAPSSTSPLTDAGDPDLPPEANLYDFRDNSRVDGARADIGAIEYLSTVFRHGFE